mgnify:FL=1
MKRSGKSGKKILEDYRRYFPSSFVEEMRATGRDIVESERDGAFIYDENGKRYIDCITSGSIYNLGRRPRAVISALKKAVRQTDQGNFPMIDRKSVG